MGVFKLDEDLYQTERPKPGIRCANYFEERTSNRGRFLQLVAQEHGEEFQRGERVGDVSEASTTESREGTRAVRRRCGTNSQEDLKIQCNNVASEL